ncbi:unnamed protein product [Allacma fusca]|uniref:Regulator of microtubule dynamics protein 1 n=1 Tax=Allacma fusca TaxID=39272 RepID=A0A8J2PKN8_9HEXA|nr:unnamed protein product [Allacma fusca]
MDFARRLSALARGVHFEPTFNLIRTTNKGKSRGKIFSWQRIRGAEKNVSPCGGSFFLGFSGIFLPLTVSAWSPSLIKKSKPDTKGINLRNVEDVQLLEDLLACDDMYTTGDMNRNDDIYNRLCRHKDKGEPELLWRLARSTYEKSKKIQDANKRKEAVEEAYALVKQSLELEDTNFAAHKWAAILLNEASTLKGLKEQITQSFNVKFHMEKAVELNPKDPTSAYLLGQWCFSVAEVPWYQQKLAAAIFATPPTSTYEEALQHFLRAEDIQPLFYSKNLLLLAKTYAKLGQPEKAHAYLKKLENLPLKTDEDFVARKEGKQLLDSLPRQEKDKAAEPVVPAV